MSYPFFIYLCTTNFYEMEIAALYELFQQHPQITTDSRNCPKGSIFFALKGASFNGNAFASKALEQGCSYAVVDEPEFCPDNDPRYLLTDDCLTTLQQLANRHRRQFPIPVIQVTGTNGKTTTKELIAAVLSKKFRVLYTQGNLNNHIGVPLTLLRLTSEHQIAIIETGANHPGEIKALAEIVEPDYGLITNVGRAHLEGFGSFEGVIQTKCELYDYLRKNNGTVFLHVNNPWLAPKAAGMKQIGYASAPTTDPVLVSGTTGACAPFLSFNWTASATGRAHQTTTHLVGTYNMENMLAAAAVGLHFQVTEEDINEALSSYVPSNNRSQLTVTTKNKLIVDAYNANPTSMAAALKNFAAMTIGPKMAILGAMKELGADSQEEHAKIIRQLQEYTFDKVWLVGSEFDGLTTEYPVFKDIEAVKQQIKQEMPEGYYILIKGSNSTHLYQLPELL